MGKQRSIMVSINTDRNGVYKIKITAVFAYCDIFKVVKTWLCVPIFKSGDVSLIKCIIVFLTPMCGRTEIEKYTLLIMSFSNLFLHFFGKEWTWLYHLALKFKAEEFFCDKIKDLYWYNNHTACKLKCSHVFSFLCFAAKLCLLCMHTESANHCMLLLSCVIMRKCGVYWEWSAETPACSCIHVNIDFCPVYSETQFTVKTCNKIGCSHLLHQ